MNKKILSATIVALSIMTTACSSADKTRYEEKSLTEKIEKCSDPDSLKAYVNEAKDYTQKLISEGRYEEASMFIDSVSPAVKEKAPALMGTFVALKGQLKVDEATENVKDAAEEVADSVSSKAGKVADKTEDIYNKTKDKVGDIADKTGKAVGKAAEKTGDAVSTAAEKTDDALNKAADKLKGK